MRNLFAIIFIFIGASCAKQNIFVYEGEYKESLTDLPRNFKPEGGYVGTPVVAARIAEAVGKQFYGDVVIENQKPLIVKKYGNIWVVQGSISSESGQKGGVFEIKISSIDGAILGMVHGK